MRNKNTRNFGWIDNKNREVYAAVTYSIPGRRCTQFPAAAAELRIPAVFYKEPVEKRQEFSILQVQLETADHLYQKRYTLSWAQWAHGFAE